MQFDLLTIFPEFFRGPLDYGVVARARAAGRLQVATHNLRDYTHDAHNTTDDRPFGGGEGMVMKIEPIFECVEALLGHGARADRDGSAARVILTSAQGRRFYQEDARRLAQGRRLVLICGRYEGVDERVALHVADEELSIGDFVLSGGELAACVILDAVARLLPGVLGHSDSAINESFGGPQMPAVPPDASSIASGGLLDCPHYTRPASFRGWEVPEVLRGGDHAAIRDWRREQAVQKTQRNRPELMARPR
jgi:tRNA (guanine37-N1)-methyltransferase